MSRINQEKINYAGPLLIKSPQSDSRLTAAGAQAQGTVDRLIRQAELEAQQILDNAKNNAQLMLDQAKTELETAQGEIAVIHEEARAQGEKEGFDKGYQDGKSEIFTELESKINAVDFFAGSNFEVKQKIMKSAQKDVIGMCIAICRKVCHKVLDETTVTKIVEQAFSLIEDKEHVNIILNPYIASMLKDEFREFSERFKNVRVLENPKIAQDAIIVEALSDRIDASVSSQIEEIASAFNQELCKSKVG